MAPAPAPNRPGDTHWLESAGGWLVAAVVWATTLWRVSEGAQWRDDLSAVRALGLVPIGGEGVVSTLLTQVFVLLPVGGRLLRAGAVSALGVAVAAALVFELTRRLLAENARAPRLGAALSVAAALMVTLSPSWQQEGTITGGATVAVPLALGTMLACPKGGFADARSWFAFGALSGLTLLESHAAGLVVLAALLLQSLLLRELPPSRSGALWAAGAAASVGVGSLLTFLRPLSPRAWVDLGYDLVGRGLRAVDVAAQRPPAIEAWLGELGLLSLALGVLALVWGVIRRQTRWVAAPLSLFVVCDTVFPATQRGLISADPVLSLRLLALVSLAAATALGVHTVALGLRRVKVPFAQPATVLLIAVDFTLVLATAEDSAYVTNRRGQHATDVWTDEAFGALPARSLVLVRSEAIAWRLWATRVARGERPDIVIVPIHLLGRGSVARRLLELEPALADVVRDIAISGRPGEYALSTLSDIRPLYVELDPTWDGQLQEHLVPVATWLRFSPHPVGRSDRMLGLRQRSAALERVKDAAIAPDTRHPATLAMVVSTLRDEALLLGALGDRNGLDESLSRLEALDPADPVAKDLRRRTANRGRGRVDIAGLLP